MATTEFQEKKRWGDLSKVYTRKKHNKRLKNCDTGVVEATTSSATPVNEAVSTETITDITNNQEKVGFEKGGESVPQQILRLDLVGKDGDSRNQVGEVRKNLSPLNVVSDGLSNENQVQERDDLTNKVQEVLNENAVINPVVVRVDDRVRINFAAANSRDEIWELRRNLLNELDQVRAMSKQLEAKQVELSGVYSNNATTAAAYSLSQHSENNEKRELVKATPEVASVRNLKLKPFRAANLSGIENNGFVSVREDDSVMGGSQLMRVNSELDSVVTVQEYRPFRHLNVSVPENNNHSHGFIDYIEKEKRTPKANQYYRNSDFLLAKDRLPPETNKKVKSNGRRKHGQMDHASSIDRFWNQAFKNCSNLLQRLMKHKHGWVFNEPVNVRLLNLHDYHDIIKNPMDLGTIKSRLAHYLYKSPREFADDVRLTFRNAKTYNPVGHDVHVMADQLSAIFEERWAVIENKYNPEMIYDMSQYGGLPTPMSRKAVQTTPPSLPILPARDLDRSEYMAEPVEFRPKPVVVPAVRTPVPKKPKAKDLNKRDMTFDERRKLSVNLESLPVEKLESVVLIIKKRNAVLQQQDDEIELDIDSFDAETLWELDRFVTNYKKSLSKYKRRAELAQARAQAQKSIHAPNLDRAYTVAAEESKAAGESRVATKSLVQAEKQGDDVSSSSSSSSSDSDSSSSDSDSDSSSAQGSDGD
ncbi:Transcription factor GTE4 [Heracleum sosnowskyi]|uniref:Transcription factor GTE4 n=1 Tax=Heracleum sosnowskyi TaxID=360622 RepID=A0AAD8IQC2_9APIA|nr:Transcription factor GTE4 [Heracleum sosnowskyi]